MTLLADVTTEVRPLLQLATQYWQKPQKRGRICAQRQLAAAQCGGGGGGQSQGLGRTVGNALGLAAHHFAPGNLGARTQPQPAREVSCRGEARHVSSRLRDHRERGGDVDAVDARQVKAL